MRIVLSIMILMLSACGLTERRSSQKIGPEVKDVSYYARSESIGIRKRILVLPFLDANVKRSEQVKEVARRVVVKELLNLRRFVVVKTSDLPGDINTYVNEDKEYNFEKLNRLANAMGISAIVQGKILEIKAERLGDQVGLFRKVRARINTKIEISVMNTKNSRKILSEIRSATVESDSTRVAEYSFSDRFLEEDPQLIQLSVVKAFRSGVVNVAQAIEKINWEGRVAMVSGDRIYVNAGRVSGIQVGDILKITEEGTEVYDPDKGTFLGRAPGRMKGTVEVISYFGKDGSIAVIHSGSGFSENDKVELY
ncbi:MAG: hypothetical protein KDD50_00420 [Bdellovibrionales bacterium]|nr:hypothetical protein [Bdellovibrionales bacterium]